MFLLPLDRWPPQPASVNWESAPGWSAMIPMTFGSVGLEEIQTRRWL
jgi:hypothetical protein